MICVRTVIKVNRLPPTEIFFFFFAMESEENLKRDLGLTFVLIVNEGYCGTLEY